MEAVDLCEVHSLKTKRSEQAGKQKNPVVAQGITEQNICTCTRIVHREICSTQITAILTQSLVHILSALHPLFSYCCAVHLNLNQQACCHSYSIQYKHMVKHLDMHNKH